MTIRDEIIWRSGIIYITMIILAVALFVKIIILQSLERSKWEEMGEKYVFKTDEMPAIRGDILADDGRLLATSVPYYSVYMDTRSSGMSPELWNSNIDGLCKGLANTIGGQTASGWKKVLTDARKRGERYFLIKRNVSYSTLKKLRELPLFREGQYKGGLIAQPENKRILPNRDLALRTIGYSRNEIDGKKVGIEASFEKELAGKNGKVLKQRLIGGDWLQVNDARSIEAVDGNDVVTTVNIELQDVAASALRNQLKKHNADHGCAVLMEVATGDIKAIANLKLESDGEYYESYNYAVGESTEPGSTFKLPVLMAALEDGVADTSDIVDTGNGTVKFYNKVIKDTKEGGYGKLTLKQVFEKSSNVGTSKIIYEHYKNNPRAFVDRLYSMRLGEKLNLQIKGEGEPFIRHPDDKLWSGLSLPMISHGYEVRLTPLQILTFYNAVANDGKMVRPTFVKEIRRKGVVIKRFDTEIIDPSIASPEVIKKAKKMLEGVVEHGTATNLKDSEYRIAGKTGTAQIAKDNTGYKSGSRIYYQASFVGYFPAEKPLYSCIVVINSPSSSVYYGNIVAGPVFKEIADKAYSTIFLRDYPGTEEDENKTVNPDAGNGYRTDIQEILRNSGIKYNKNGDDTWIATREIGNTVKIVPLETNEKLIPDVRGMTLRDALFLLENSGLKVEFTGRGRVKKQMPEHGTRINGEMVVSLVLGV
ncbi:MAG TPA: penicillin-binding transpeptidase domain-containing protein [Bacteroidales bacterium]|nr:penicillin-binding transpeptidase domain-containing protein [Bacteroidales bacterium]